MKSTIEKFKDIPGYEGLYQVSDYGTVRSLRFGKVRYFKLHRNKKGYLIVDLSRCANRKTFYVHRLVWEAFNGTIPDGMQIDHINTVRDDNRLINLRMVTPMENQNNPITLERLRKANLESIRENIHKRSLNENWRKNQLEGTRKACNKPVLQLDKQTGEVIRKWECAMDAYRDIGIYFKNISECCNGKRKSAGGFRWCFA